MVEAPTVTRDGCDNLGETELTSVSPPAMMDASGQPINTSGVRLDVGEEEPAMDTEFVVTGAIVDSWVEPSGAVDEASRLVLQVAPKGRPKDLMIVEAEASLVADRGWLQDLGENLCHGSPVAAVGRLTLGGFFSATELRLAR
jgi:hypothetical protein